MKKIALIMAMLMLALTLCACSDAEIIKVADEFEPPYQYDLSDYLEIDRDDYVGLKLEAVEVEVTDEEVNEAIAVDLDAYGETVDVTDRGAEMGDTLNIDFTGYESGVAFEGGTATGHEMVLGQAGFIDGFEDQLVGHKAGEEFTIDVTFPENYNEALAGKPAQFVIKINSIKNKVPAQLTEEFVKEKFFCNTIEDYLRQKHDEIKAQKETEADNELKNSAYEAIYANVKVNKLPEEEYNAYKQLIATQITAEAAAYGFTLEDYIAAVGMSTADYTAFLDDQASYRISQELIMFSIIYE